jgi:BirA family transcriptional regulator, biotin operon repressor / biotin---[acetyl-CoA-carboxylase] ligase
VGPREFYDSIASTQDRARELAQNGAPEGTRVVALEQTRGRGRLDHGWSSPPGGLYLSIVLRAPPEHVSWLPLALGARLADGLARGSAADFRVKWPNDVLAGSAAGGFRKVAGVLVDRLDGRWGTAEVAGIGVNVSTPLSAFPPELRASATSLLLVAPPAPSPADVEQIVVQSALDAAAGLVGRENLATTRALCRRWLWGVGRPARVDGVPAGTIVGLDEDGALLVRRGDETTPIRAGEVRVEEPG